MKIIVAICIILFLVGCNKSTNFYKLDNMYSVYCDENNTKQIYEYIVIENPPVKYDSLAIVINNYNDTTLNYCILDTTNIVYFQRSFYRNTREMPIDYKEDHSFISDVIADHLDDLIAVVKKDKNNNWTLELKTHNNPDKWQEFKIDKKHIKEVK